jgi:hypothetical protein
MILAINNALIVTRNKAAPITSAGDFAALCPHFLYVFVRYPSVFSANKPKV